MAKKVKVLRVIAKRDGFRRAGMEFGSVPKNLPLDTLSEDTQKALRDDPSLVTYEVIMVMDEHGDLTDVPLQDIEALEAREKALDEREADLVKREAALAAKTKATK